jgi:hypothetical protein
MAVNTYRLTISYNCAGQFAQNVLHYSFDDGLYADTTVAAQALNAAFNTHCTAKIKDALSTHVQILSFKSRRVTTAGGFEAVLLGGVGDVGARVGDLSASGLAPMIRLVTNNVPPKTGRVFLPGVSDNDCDEGFLTSGLFTEMSDLADALDDPLTLAGGGAPLATPVLYSQSPVVDSIPITIAVPSPYLCTQRRRQRPA